MSPDPYRQEGIRPGETSPFANQPLAPKPAPAGDFAALQPGTPLTNLGNLAQKAREKPLRHARGWLIFVGVCTILLNLFLLFNLSKEVKTELDKQHREMAAKGMVLTNARELETLMYVGGGVIYGATILLGAVFIVLACLMLRFPLPTTIASMVLFLLSQVVFGVLNPASLCAGFIVKIIVFFVLVNAIKAAVAYERHKRENMQFQPEF